MTVRGLASATIKYYCIQYTGRINDDVFSRSVTIRQKFPPTDYRALTVARADFSQFSRGDGSVLSVQVTGVNFGPCSGFNSGGGGGGGCTAPVSPVITAAADEDSIFIDWATVTGATSYIVKRSTVHLGQ